MESRRKRSRGQIVKWICYALLGLLCAVLQTTPGLFQFGAAKPLWLLPLALAVAVLFLGAFMKKKSASSFAPWCSPARSAA